MRMLLSERASRYGPSKSGLQAVRGNPDIASPAPGARYLKAKRGMTKPPRLRFPDQPGTAYFAAASIALARPSGSVRNGV
jgi:hypothetical protein